MLVFARGKPALAAALALALAVLALAALQAPPGSVAAEQAAGGDQARKGNPGPIGRTLRAINGRRRAFGLRALRYDRKLARAARRHSGDMVRNRFFSHYGSGGSSPEIRIRRAGYLAGASFWRVGETIGAGMGRRGKPRRIVRSWMRSPGHRALLLDPGFREIGIGIVGRYPTGRRGGTYTATLGTVKR